MNPPLLEPIDRDELLVPPVAGKYVTCVNACCVKPTDPVTPYPHPLFPTPEMSDSKRTIGPSDYRTFGLSSRNRVIYRLILQHISQAS
jgi:hypothetical protein